MLTWTPSFASGAVTLIGALIFWSNPSRLVNRAVGLCSLNVAGWLLAWSFAGEGLFWIRTTCAIGAFCPLSFWNVKNNIIGSAGASVSAGRRRNFVWVAIPLLLASIAYSDFFIPSDSIQGRRVYGPGYYFYIAGLLWLYGSLIYGALKTIKLLSGVRRLELQVWLVGGCVVALTVYALMTLTAITHDPMYRRLEPLAVLLFYAGTAYIITTHRIFDARQIILVAIQKIALVGLVSGVAYSLDLFLGLMLPPSIAFVATTILALWFAVTLNGWLNSFFQFYPQATAARQAAFAVARRESRLENLEAAFVGILKGWGQTDHALMMSGGKESLRGTGVELSGDAIEVKALRQLRWATPERIAREKATPERVALGAFLEAHKLGALVIGEGPTLTAFIGIGIAASRRPFTYPQVTQLMELASIIESALERAHFSVKAQHAEQLATVGLLGASLAHEIRNPLVSIKTFVQLLPTHHQDPAFRAKFFSLIGEEVSRIDRLTEQLLDLASPRAYVAEIIELHPVLRTSLDLVTAKATDKRIQFLTDFQASPDRALTDASAAKQVLLNLCFNAIQAVESRQGDRWVKVSTCNVPLGLEMIVEDSGPGIAPEIRSKLFQPFHSTKSTGFGLGLAICSDILGGLNATISVDASAPGQGAVFRVTFPCPVLSS
jgi:signal transduction histidine kinase